MPHFSTFTRERILQICEELGLEELITDDYSFPGSDPMDKGTLDHLNGAIDTYIGKAKDLEDNSELLKRGEQLRERLYSSGFHAATSLVLLGRKPSSGI